MVGRNIHAARRGMSMGSDLAAGALQACHVPSMGIVWGRFTRSVRRLNHMGN